jgi:hypothetical protein
LEEKKNVKGADLVAHSFTSVKYYYCKTLSFYSLSVANTRIKADQIGTRRMSCLKPKCKKSGCGNYRVQVNALFLHSDKDLPAQTAENSSVFPSYL